MGAHTLVVMSYASLNELLNRLWEVETDTYPEGEPFVEAVRSGSMSIEIYAPRGEDIQEPHDQDEAYIIVQGKAALMRGDDEIRCGSGDVIVVPAGVVHRFVEMTDDFMCWAIFWGPPGGEAQA